MSKIKGLLKRGMGAGLALTLMLSGTACGKKDVVVDDYNVGADSSSDEAASASDSDSEKAEGKAGSLTEIYGDTISDTNPFGVGGVTVNFDVNYKVPEADQINVYVGSILENDADIEKQIVSSFFGGTEKELEEIKYVNETEYIPLLYKYRSLLELQTSPDSSDADPGMTNTIDSSFEEVYTWLDDDSYYIHMYEGEYNGNRYGMIYSYNKTTWKRNIYISPISLEEYFPEVDAQTLFVVGNEFNPGTTNSCSMSKEDIMSDASGVMEKLGLKNFAISPNPDMAIENTSSVFTFFSDSGEEETVTEMTKLFFADANLLMADQKMMETDPAFRLYSFDLLKEQNFEEEQHNLDDVTLMENGYAVYLCIDPFSGNIKPQKVSSFNRGSIYYTDKGLYSVDICQIAEIDNVVENVELLPYETIKEAYKTVLETDPQITDKNSGSVDVKTVAFTYVLVEDGESNKASYVPAWYFIATDNQLKDGDQRVEYTHVINAIDGSNLNDSLR